VKKKTIAFVAVSTLLSLTAVWAQAKKKYPVLQPQMTVEGSTYSKPMGTMGEKPTAEWTGTTVGAAVDGKANPAKIVTVKGEVIDLSCYLQIGKHGEKHRACGQKCVNSGQPVGLLLEDGSVYMLMEEEHDPRRDGQTMSDFRKAASDHMAHIMEVTGTQSSHAGITALYVQGFVKK
jgi:hypothetical protein